MADPDFGSYGFEPATEKYLVGLACTRPSLYGRVLHAVQPEGLDNDGCQILLKAIREIAKETGQGPSHVSTVLQTLRNWREDGKLDRGDMKTAKRVISFAMEEESPPPTTELIASAMPLIQRRMREAALDLGLEDIAAHGNLTRVSSMLDQAARLGRADLSLGARFGPGQVASLRRISKLRRLSTGIPELDDELRGGPREGSYTLFTAGAKVGKSMALLQMAAQAMTERLNVAIATLEVGADEQFARLTANLTNIPTDDILEEDDMMAEAERRLTTLGERGLLGACIIKEFAAGISPGDVEEWLKLEEAYLGEEIQVLVIDYPDKMKANDGKLAKKDADREVAEALRGFARRPLRPDMNVRWTLGASQAKAEAHDRKKTKVVEGHHAADSIDKFRICDLMITLNPRDGELVAHVAANRMGPGGGTVGPFPTEYEYGRVSPVERPGWPF